MKKIIVILFLALFISAPALARTVEGYDENTGHRIKLKAYATDVDVTYIDMETGESFEGRTLSYDRETKTARVVLYKPGGGYEPERSATVRLEKHIPWSSSGKKKDLHL